MKLGDAYRAEAAPGIEEAAAALQAELGQPVPHYRSFTRSWVPIETNDREFHETIDAVAEGGVPNPELSLAVGLIVGNGYLHSMLPELPVDIVVGIDESAAHAEWLRYKHQTLTQARTARSFLKELQPGRAEICDAILEREQKANLVRINRYHYEQAPYEYPVNRWFDEESEETGQYHFLANHSRYKTARHAAQETPLVTAEIEVFNPADMKRLTGALANIGAQVTFANFTNVWEYRPGDKAVALESMASLPLHPQALIAYSSSVEYLDDGYIQTPHIPISHQARGFGEYAERAVKDAKYFHTATGGYEEPFKPRD